MIDYYPPVSYYFSLSFSGVTGQTEASFKEVSGISIEIPIEEIKEGGVNSFKHRVPSTIKHSNLVLRRGLISKDSLLAKWCKATLDGGLNNPIETKTILVSLLDENLKPLKTWSFADAWPVKWDISDFNSVNDELVVETIEFSYSYFQVIK
jgi:phage tail-like protein